MTISRSSLVGYGAAELGVSGSEVMLRVGLLIYYTQIIGLRPELASYAIAIGVIWDAVSDPIMGRISDYANINGQKRRPFMLPGAIGLAIFIYLIFNVPALETQTSKFFYLLATYLGINTFLTILSVPHIALGGDISKEPEIRMKLFGSRLIFANIGLILGTIIPAIAVMCEWKSIPPDASASRVMALLTLFGVGITLLSTSNLDKASSSVPRRGHSLKSYFQELSHVLSNRSFSWLLVAYMTATIGLTLNSSLALYYYKYYLQLDDVTVRGIIAFFMFVFCLAIPFWIWVARFFPKHVIIIINILLLGLMTIFGYPLFPPGSAIGPLLAGVFGGIFVGSVVLLDVAVADLADQQAARAENQESNQGIYFGFWKMGLKLSRAIALILTGNLLQWAGFTVTQIPDKATSFRLALLFGPGVGVFLLAAVALIYIGYKKGNAYD
jgi:Na+/melibiose symporter-like transporter